jgi:hypothetical protein
MVELCLYRGGWGVIGVEDEFESLWVFVFGDGIESDGGNDLLDARSGVVCLFGLCVFVCRLFWDLSMAGGRRLEELRVAPTDEAVLLATLDHGGGHDCGDGSFDGFEMTVAIKALGESRSRDRQVRRID